MSIDVTTDSTRHARATGRSAGQQHRRARDFFCHSCGVRRYGHDAPAGWYTLLQATGGTSKPRATLYCTLPCLIKAERQLQSGTPHSVKLRDRTLDDKARLTRRLEQMFALLHNGMTLRQAGDVLEMPTETVRSWLADAGISIDVNGRLAMPAVPPSTQQAPTQSLREFVTAHPGGSPISIVYELEQAGHIGKPDWSEHVAGPSHKPTFTYTVSTVLTVDGATVAAEAEGHSKADAKTAAARALIDRFIGE